MVLLLAAVAATVAALLPTYYADGEPLADDPGNLWFNIVPLAGWCLSAWLLKRPTHQDVAAGMAAGLTLVDLAYQGSDIGSVVVGANRVAAGFVLGNVGTGLAVLGSATALFATRGRFPSNGSIARVAPAWALAIAATLVGSLVLPALRATRSLAHGVFTSTGRNTFSNDCCNPFHGRPGYSMAATAALILLAVVVPAVAIRCTRGSVGFGLFVGVSVGVLATWASWTAYFATTHVTLDMFGFTQTQASQYGVTVTVHPASGYLAGAVAAVALVIALARRRQSTADATHPSRPQPSSQPTGQAWLAAAATVALVLTAIGATHTSGLSATARASVAVGAPPSTGSAGGSSDGGATAGSGGFAFQPGLGATAVCSDGTYSYSAHHQGTCSHHGGVSRWLDSIAATSAPAPPPPSVTVEPPSVEAPSMAAPTTTTAPTASTPTQPTVKMTPAAGASPIAGEVQDLFSSFFQGINDHDYATPFTSMTPREQQAVGGLATYAKGNSTSYDDDVEIRRIQATATGAIVDVSFRSEQAAANAPRPGETCTRWVLRYRLLRDPVALHVDDVQTLSNTACAPPTPSSSNTDAVSVPVVTCSTTFGVDGQNLMSAPPTMTVNIGSSAAEQLAAYTDTAGIMRVLAPRGWSCQAAYGANGAGSIQVFAAGTPTPAGLLPVNSQAITAHETSACVSCAEEQACPVFSSAAFDYQRDFGEPCRSRAEGETVTPLSPSVVRFEDPGGVSGIGQPSGGIYAADGVMTYSPGAPDGSWTETCTLPQTQQALCNATLNAFVASYSAS